MHPSIEYPSFQQHLGDLRREADERRRHRRHRPVPTFRRRQHASGPVAVLPPSARRVLVYAEREPSPDQLEALLLQLATLRDDTVTLLVHQRPARARVVGRPGVGSVPAGVGTARVPAQRQPGDAEQGLGVVVDALHGAGHRATGEVVAGSPSRALVDAVDRCGPEAVILLTEHHRLAALAHRDLPHRLLTRTDAPVLALVGV